MFAFFALFSFPLFAGAATLRPPSNLRAWALDNTCSAEVTWKWVVGGGDERPSDDVWFEAQRKQSGGGVLTSPAIPSTGFISGPAGGGMGTYAYKFTDTGLSPSEIFSYRVITKGSSGAEAAFPPGEDDFHGSGQGFSESAYPVPVAPRDISVSWVGGDLESKRTNKTVLVRWKGDAGMKPEAGGFQIFRHSGSGDFDITGLTPIGRGTIADDSFAVDDDGYFTYRDNGPDLSPANSYSYKVQAFYASSGCSP